MVGAVPPAHLNDEGHATVLGVPSAVKITVKPMAIPDVAGVFEIVKVVTFAFSVQAKMLDALRSSVSVFDDMLTAATASVYRCEV